jgi:hypothetical protein
MQPNTFLAILSSLLIASNAAPASPHGNANQKKHSALAFPPTGTPVATTGTHPHRPSGSRHPGDGCLGGHPPGFLSGVALPTGGIPGSPGSPPQGGGLPKTGTGTRPPRPTGTPTGPPPSGLPKKPGQQRRQADTDSDIPLSIPVLTKTHGTGKYPKPTGTQRHGGLHGKVFPCGAVPSGFAHPSSHHGGHGEHGTSSRHGPRLTSTLVAIPSSIDTPPATTQSA